MSTILLVNLLVFVSLTSAGSHSQSCSPPTAKYLTVNTSNGPITGHLSTNTSCVIEYLGIPYAKPPIGDLRFAPPQRITAKTPYNAASFGYDCPLTASKPVDYPGFTPQAQRIVNYFASAAGTPQSEDCLTLNIWTKPTTNADQKKKPVFVFFYGGRFTIGNTNTPFYTGKYFAEAEDILVITVNYRLNIFGFPGAPDSTQNLGLRDQRAAVEWIRDNISLFGGDPSKITLSGQSSGGPFPSPPTPKLTQQTNWNTVAIALNCSKPIYLETLSCMRQIPWQTLESAAASIKPAKSTSVLRSIPPFWPTPDNQLVFSAPDYLSLTTNGTFAKIPILLGNNHNENGYYQIPAFAQGVIPTKDQITSFLLESFTCPVSYQAAARRNHGVAAYVYRYFADWENTRLYATSGAYHGVELHMVFGASGDVSRLVTGEDQGRLTRLMQRAWFMFSSDPDGGLEREFGWGRFDAGGETLVQLGLGNVPQVRFTYPAVYDGGCGGVTLGALGTIA